MTINYRPDPTPDCEPIRELLPDYAFGLSTDDEKRHVESGLAGCPDALIALAEFRQLQDEMRASVPQLTPPADLFDRLMVTIAPSAPAPVPTIMPPVRRSSAFVWQLAAIAAVIALVLSNLFWATRANQLSAQKNDLTAQLEQLTASLSGNSGQTPAFILNSTTGLRWVRLPPSQQNTDTSAFLMWNAESKIGLLYAHSFPQLQAGMTYQLWLTRGEERKSVGTFTVDDKGKGALLFHSEEPIDKFTWARITAEPTNGSPTPGNTIVVIGKLAT